MEGFRTGPPSVVVVGVVVGPVEHAVVVQLMRDADVGAVEHLFQEVLYLAKSLGVLLVQRSDHIGEAGPPGIGHPVRVNVHDRGSASGVSRTLARPVKRQVELH